MRTPGWILFLFLTSSLAFGQETAPPGSGSPIRIQPFFLGGFSLVWEGQTYGTAFGLDAILEARLRSIPRNQSLIDSYEAKTLWGGLLWYGGLAGFLGGGLLLGLDPSQMVPALAGAGLQYGGTIALVSGPFVMGSGAEDLRLAVGFYNETLTETASSDTLSSRRIEARRDWLGLVLWYRGSPSGTAWGPDPILADLLDSNPEAGRLMRESDAKRNLGFGLLGGGAGAYFGAAAIMFVGMTSNPGYREVYYIAASTVALAGLVAVLASPWVLGAASQDLEEAVLVYNAGL